MRLGCVLLVFLALSLSSQANAEATPAPELELDTQNGTVNLNQFKGRVVYLDFWASWCKPCVQSFPWMQTLQATYQSQGLEIIAINLDKDRALADAFLEKVTVDFTVAFDPKGDTAKIYQLRGMPTSFLIGRDGKIYATHIGFRETDKLKLKQAVLQLLDQ
jgi:thiol-disulfide isomerase/thioredoxin